MRNMSVRGEGKSGDDYQMRVKAMSSISAASEAEGSARFTIQAVKISFAAITVLLWIVTVSSTSWA